MERLLTYLETKVFPGGYFFNSRAKAFIERLAELAIAADGTCTGVHGIGEGKKHFLVRSMGKPRSG